MKTMGKYCKAYLLKKMREFSGWSEKAENARKEKEVVDGKEIEKIRELTDDSIVYLQENYVVTDGIFKDENIIFGDVTPEWIEYCQKTLAFEIPDYARGESAAAAAQSAQGA
jgi:hypothetical protein